jgi:hypothetical protein
MNAQMSILDALDTEPKIGLLEALELGPKYVGLSSSSTTYTKKYLVSQLNHCAIWIMERRDLFSMDWPLTNMLNDSEHSSSLYLLESLIMPIWIRNSHLVSNSSGLDISLYSHTIK